MNTTLSDLEVLVLQCRSPKARSYLGEAIACYKSGGFRAAIVMTWLAVVFDLISKFEELALGGDVNAQRLVDQLGEIVRRADTRQSLDFEQSILETARDQFELLSPLAFSDLERLREDRHKCAHPSMIDPQVDYRPTPEAVRYHIVNAANHLLVHGPAQGKAAIDRLLSELNSSLFPTDAPELIVHLEHGPLGRPRESLVRNYLLVLLKELLLAAPEEDGDFKTKLRESLSRGRRESRIMATLQATSVMHRASALRLYQERFDELVSRAPDSQLSSAVCICAGFIDAWHALSLGQKQRIGRFIRSLTKQNIARVANTAVAIPELASEVQARLADASEADWDALGKFTPAPAIWVEHAIGCLEVASDARGANPMRHFLAANAHQIDDSQVRRILAAAKCNSAIAKCWGVKESYVLSGIPTRLAPRSSWAFLRKQTFPNFAYVNTGGQKSRNLQKQANSALHLTSPPLTLRPGK